jgi:hypothetical protein
MYGDDKNEHGEHLDSFKGERSGQDFFTVTVLLIIAFVLFELYKGAEWLWRWLFGTGA